MLRRYAITKRFCPDLNQAANGYAARMATPMQSMDTLKKGVAEAASLKFVAFAKGYRSVPIIGIRPTEIVY